MADCGVNLYVARGYSSETYLENAAEEIEEDGRPTYVYILSDFDPSGINLAETVMYGGRKMASLAARTAVPVTVRRLALTREQVEDLHLTTLTIKSKDSRARQFVERYFDGDASRAFACELDAVRAPLLREWVREAIESHIPPKTLEIQQKIEAEEDKWLERFGQKAAKRR